MTTNCISMIPSLWYTDIVIVKIFYGKILYLASYEGVYMYSHKYSHTHTPPFILITILSIHFCTYPQPFSLSICAGKLWEFYVESHETSGLKIKTRCSPNHGQLTLLLGETSIQTTFGNVNSNRIMFAIFDNVTVNTLVGPISIRNMVLLDTMYIVINRVFIFLDNLMVAYFGVIKYIITDLEENVNTVGRKHEC